MQYRSPVARAALRSFATRASLLAVLAPALLAACNPSAPAGAAAPAAAPPPPQVGVITVSPQRIGVATELPGRLEPSRVAQVRARAAGNVQKRLFREGGDVKAGQALFTIDATPYRAALGSAQAVLARAQANLAQASAQAERFKPLIEANAISQQEFVNAVAARKTAEADVAAARAAVQTAQINLGYANVTAPISGRIGRALVTEGALVGQGEATPLAVIQQVDPMYVNFTQSTTDVRRLRRALASGQLQRAGAGESAAVQVVLDDGSVYAQAGRLLFTDLTVDPSSGQVTLRAELPNPDGLLLPGMYVRVRLVQAQLSDAILVPQQAVQRSNRGDTVFVLGADNKPASRAVKVGSAQAGQWIVLDGLQAGERVVVDGFQKMGPGGAPVTPVPWAPAGSAAAASAPAAAPSAPAAAASKP
jgi:membrane fusion protein (multidrug efflux system)